MGYNYRGGVAKWGVLPQWGVSGPTDEGPGKVTSLLRKEVQQQKSAITSNIYNNYNHAAEVLSQSCRLILYYVMELING